MSNEKVDAAGAAVGGLVERWAGPQVPDFLPPASTLALAARLRGLIADTVSPDDPVTTSGDHFRRSGRLRDLADLDLTGLLLPLGYGGGGGTLLDLCVANEELGRSGATSPLVCSGGVVADLVVRSGQGPRFSAMLTDVARGAAIATFTRQCEQRSVGVRRGSGWLVSGELSLVEYAHDAEWLLVAPHLEGVGRSLALLHLPHLDEDTVRFGEERLTSGGPASSVLLREVPVERDAVLLSGHAAVLALADRALAVHDVAQAAHAIGAAHLVLDGAETGVRERLAVARRLVQAAARALDHAEHDALTRTTVAALYTAWAVADAVRLAPRALWSADLTTAPSEALRQLVTHAGRNDTDRHTARLLSGTTA